MNLLDSLVERRIAEAQARGEFDGLPSAGRPLDLEEDPLVPDDVRVAYRILRNAGFVPPEVEHRREMKALEARAKTTSDPDERQRALRKLQMLALQCARERPDTGLCIEAKYWGKIIRRLG
jgi:hypothetical protein